MNDPLFTNKLAGAVLTALLLIFGLPQLTAAIFGGHGGGHHDQEGWPFPQYPELDLDVSTDAAEIEAPPDLGTLLAAASAQAGERRSALCKSCHTFEQGGASGNGPNLWNIVGGSVANVAGFNYSGALKELGGVWSYERLDGYLKDSQAYAPGTAMVQRFARDNQRADLLAYLQTLSSNPVAFPAPVVAEEATGEPEGPSDAAGATEAPEAMTESIGETVEDVMEEMSDDGPN